MYDCSLMFEIECQCRAVHVVALSFRAVRSADPVPPVRDPDVWSVSFFCVIFMRGGERRQSFTVVVARRSLPRLLFGVLPLYCREGGFLSLASSLSTFCCRDSTALFVFEMLWVGQFINSHLGK